MVEGTTSWLIPKLPISFSPPKKKVAKKAGHDLYPFGKKKGRKGGWRKKTNLLILVGCGSHPQLTGSIHSLGKSLNKKQDVFNPTIVHHSGTRGSWKTDGQPAKEASFLMCWEMR